MINQEQSKPSACKLYLPMSFNFHSKHRLAKLIQSPNRIQFFPEHQTIRCHQFKPSPKNKNFYHGAISERNSKFRQSKITKWSISRMLEKAKPQMNTISAISQLYKKSGEKQIMIKKSKEKTQSTQNLMKDVIEYKSIKLRKKQNGRYPKTAQTKCRYHRNHESINMRTLNSTRQEPRIKITKRQKRTITVTKHIPPPKQQNWTVQSWNTPTTKFQNSQI